MTSRRWPRVAAPFAAALATATTMALMAAAHHADTTDPNDTRGRLDVKRVRFDHQGPPNWRVVTFSKWTIRGMWDRGYIMVLLDTAGGEAAEYYLLVRSNGRSLEGSLWRARAVGPDSRLGSAKVWRRSGRSVTVQVRLRRLDFGEKRTVYRWWAHTTFTDDVCRRSCHDRAPDRGAIEQWRPGMSPDPSPSDPPSP